MSRSFTDVPDTRPPAQAEQSLPVGFHFMPGYLDEFAQVSLTIEVGYLLEQAPLPAANAPHRRTAERADVERRRVRMGDGPRRRLPIPRHAPCDGECEAGNSRSNSMIVTQNWDFIKNVATPAWTRPSCPSLSETRRPSCWADYRGRSARADLQFIAATSSGSEEHRA